MRHIGFFSRVYALLLLLTASDLPAQSANEQILRISVQEALRQPRKEINLLNVPFLLTFTDFDKNGSITDAGVDIVSLKNTLTNQTAGDFIDQFDSFYVQGKLFVFKAGKDVITLNQTLHEHSTPVGNAEVFYDNIFASSLPEATKLEGNFPMRSFLQPENVQDSLLYFFFSFEGCGGCIQSIPYLRELKSWKVKTVVCHALEPYESEDEVLESVRANNVPGTHFRFPDNRIRQVGISSYPSGILCKSNGDVIRYVSPRRLLNLLSRRKNGTVPSGTTSDTMRVLFVGNSLSYYNDMDRTFSDIAAGHHLPVAARKMCFSGFSLADHIRLNVEEEQVVNKEITLFEDQLNTLKKGEVSRTIREIQKGDWDCIVLQGVMPYEEDLKQTLAVIDSLVRATNPGCQLFLMQNYSTVLWSDTVRARKLEEINRQISEALSAGMQVIPAGDLFHFMNKHNPQLELFPDDEHPSPEGSYLMAELIVAEILRNKPESMAGTPQNDLFSSGLHAFYQNKLKR